MTLSDSQKAQAEAALTGKTNRCPICAARARDFQPRDLVTATAGLDGTPSAPLLRVVCSQCHFVAHFDAVALGLVNPGTRSA